MWRQCLVDTGYNYNTVDMCPNWQNKSVMMELILNFTSTKKYMFLNTYCGVVLIIKCERQLFS